MEQLQQANVGNPENILQSVQAADYSPLKSQMELGVRLMDAGFQGGSATNRQAMTNQTAMDRDRFQEQSIINTEQRKEKTQQRSDLGTLTAIIADFDDAIDNANPDDPAVSRYLPAVVRKRDQLLKLLELGGRSPQHLGGILKQNETSQSLTPQKQARMIDRPYSPESKTDGESKSPKKDESKPSGGWHSTPSSNTIN